MRLNTVSDGYIFEIGDNKYIFKIPVQFLVSEDENPSLSKVQLKDIKHKKSSLIILPDGDVSVYPDCNFKNDDKPIKFPIAIRPIDSATTNNICLSVPVLSKGLNNVDGTIEVKAFIDFVFRGVCETKFEFDLLINVETKRFSIKSRRIDSRFVILTNMLIFCLTIFLLREWNESTNKYLFHKARWISYESISNMIIFTYGFLGLQAANFLPSVVSLKKLQDVYNFPELYFSPTLLCFYKRGWVVAIHAFILSLIVTMIILTIPVNLKDVKVPNGLLDKDSLAYVDGSGVQVKNDQNVPIYMLHNNKVVENIFPKNQFFVLSEKFIDKNGAVPDYNNYIIGEIRAKSVSAISANLEFVGNKTPFYLDDSFNPILYEIRDCRKHCSKIIDTTFERKKLIDDLFSIMNNSCFEFLRSPVEKYFKNIKEDSAQIIIERSDNNYIVRNASLLPAWELENLLANHKIELEMINIQEMAKSINAPNINLTSDKNVKLVYKSVHDLMNYYGKPKILASDIVDYVANFKSVSQAKSASRAKYLTTLISIFTYFKSNHYGEISKKDIEIILETYNSYYNSESIVTSNRGVDNTFTLRMWNRFLVELSFYQNDEDTIKKVSDSIETILKRPVPGEGKNIYTSFLEDVEFLVKNYSVDNDEAYHVYYKIFFNLANSVGKKFHDDYMKIENSNIESYRKWANNIVSG